MTNPAKCFITDKECKTTDISYEGETYYVEEELAEDNSLKKIRDMIKNKIESIQKEKEDAMGMLEMACSKLGLSKEDIGRMLLGNNSAPPQVASPPENEPKVIVEKPIKVKDDGFQEVDGDLKSEIKANVSSEQGIGEAMPAYSTIHGEDGKSVREEGKRVKRLDDAIITKSNMGTTVIRMDHRSGKEIESLITELDNDGNLVRASASGSGRASGQRTIDCPLCGGSGITRINHQKCPKCGGTGIITA